MASQKSPSPPPPVPTTVLALGDDLLREIFLRLPSLPSLVRAALACRAFLHAVRSFPAFRRSFLALRPPPLLGLFLDPEGPTMPSFAPVRPRSDRDLAAAVRGADFFLTRLIYDHDAAASPGWIISDCRQGYVLLVNCDTEQLSLYNPLTGALDLSPPLPDKMFDEMRGSRDRDCCILSSQEGGGPLRLLCTCHDESRWRAAVFSCDSREWQIFPWSEPVTPQSGEKYWRRIGTMVNGFVYWVRAADAYKIVLNTATLEFSQMCLPTMLEGRGHVSMVGETKDGKLCIVCPLELSLFVWIWRANADGIESWVFDKWFPLETIVELTKGTLEQHRELKVVAIIDGFVYFCAAETFNFPPSLAWFLSLCMETAELDKLFQKKFDSHINPYVMAWPPTLVDNEVRLQLEGA